MKLTASDVYEDSSSNDSSVTEMGSENSWMESASTSSQELPSSQPDLQNGTNGSQNLPGSSVQLVTNGNHELPGFQASITLHRRNHRASSRDHPYNGHPRHRSSVPSEDPLIGAHRRSTEQLESIASSLRQMLAVTREINTNICRLSDNLTDLLNRLITKNEAKEE